MMLDTRTHGTRRNGPMCRISQPTHELLSALRERAGLPSMDALIHALAGEALTRAQRETAP